MTLLKDSNFPDFSSIRTDLCNLLSPLSQNANLKLQFPQGEFDISATKPTITVSIKDIAIYKKYLNSVLPTKITLAIGVYVPKSQDSATCYLLFSEIARIVAEEGFGKISCTELEYIPDLRHYCLKAEAVMTPINIKEEQDGDTDI